MKSISTSLRTLSNCLSGRSKKIFPNQVVFYNAVFGATNPMILPDEFLEGMNRISQGQGREEDEPLVKQVNYLLRSGLDSNSANVGKHINNAPELPIPRQHKAHFLDEANRSDIVHRLQAIIGFCLAFHPGRFRLDKADFAELLRQMKSDLSEASHTLAEADELSVGLLANVVYEVLVYHLSRLQERYYPAPEGEQKEKVDLEKQKQEYAEKVECFGSSNVDRFFAMRRLADSNVVAAHELACVYYYGARYYETDEGEGNTGFYEVEQDKDLAAFYYKKAVSCDPPVVEACWSLGYMLVNRMFTDIQEDEADELARGYFQYALEHGYTPALNNLGMLELSAADELLKEAMAKGEQGQRVSEEDKEEILSRYCRGLELCDQAGCAGYVYGHINVANFLAEERYAASVWPAVKRRVRLNGPLNLRERWQAAADLENLWAMNQLALLDCREGRGTSAVEIWEKAASYHYPAASLNLALYVYGPEGIRTDRRRYQKYLEQASADGSAQASVELARLYEAPDPFMALLLLSRAEEQNYKKFNNRLYHQIQELRETVQRRMENVK